MLSVWLREQELGVESDIEIREDCGTVNDMRRLPSRRPELVHVEFTFRIFEELSGGAQEFVERCVAEEQSVYGREALDKSDIRLVSGS